MRVFFTNLGCKLNQAELEHLARGDLDLELDLRGVPLVRDGGAEELSEPLAILESGDCSRWSF